MVGNGISSVFHAYTSFGENEHGNRIMLMVFPPPLQRIHMHYYIFSIM